MDEDGGYGGLGEALRNFEKGVEMEYADVEVPMPVIEEPCWMVGDGMRDAEGNKDYVIAQIAIVLIDDARKIFEVRYSDSNGVCRGDQKMQLCKTKSMRITNRGRKKNSKD